MTGNSILLDTNIIAALFKGDAFVAGQIDLSLQVFIPVIVIGELHYGAAYSAQIEQNNARIQKLLEYTPCYQPMQIQHEYMEQ